MSITSLKEENSQINQSNKSNQLLSPFTWSNIKFPPIVKLPPKQQHQEKQNESKLQAVKQTKKASLQIKKNLISKKSPQRSKPIQNKKIKKSVDYSLDMGSLNNQSIQSKLTDKLKDDKKISRMKARSQIEKTNKTIEIARTQQKISQIQKEQQMKKFRKVRYLDQKNNMQKYMKNNLLKAGWSQSKNKDTNNAELLWANFGKSNDFNNIKQGQFYNHLNGSHILTNKDKLHEYLSVSGQIFYPKSFLIPKQYDLFSQQNNKIAIKCMLYQISQQILQFLKNPLDKVQLFQVDLSEIVQLSSFMKNSEQEIHMLIKLCKYLQTIRIQEGYNQYFEKFSSYKKPNLPSKQVCFNNLMEKAYNYLEKNKEQYLKFSFYDIDYRILILILHYHNLFSQKDMIYSENNYLWIIKPIASSRGAGISLVRSCRQFCSNTQSLFFEFKNRKKYQNKVIQQYIPHPLLLKNPPQYSNRKFDIRQWVLVLSFKNKPQIYKYHTAYCRFSQQKFTLNKLNKQIHLTNYSLFKQSNQKPQQSIMMLQDLYSNVSYGDLRNKYNQQIDYIIKQTIVNCKSIKYQKGCFELFGFDFFIDKNQKVYLLQVNLNPSCDSQRHPALKKQAEIMSLSMMDLVMSSKQSNNWNKIYGQKRSQFENEISEQIDEQNTQIKPYYKTNLDEQSLIGYIKNKQRKLFVMCYLAQKSIYHRFISRLNPDFKQVFQVPEVKQEDAMNSDNNDNKPLINFIQQRSVTNRSMSNRLEA